jgi:hypothetical protein
MVDIRATGPGSANAEWGGGESGGQGEGMVSSCFVGKGGGFRRIAVGERNRSFSRFLGCESVANLGAIAEHFTPQDHQGSVAGARRGLLGISRAIRHR